MTPRARQTLEDLMARAPEQVLKAEDVVQAARPRNSPLHPYFTWDNASAAHEFRLVQARALLRSVTVLNPEALQAQPTVRYVSLMMDRSQAGGGYRDIETVMASDALREELLQTALRELNGWLNRYNKLSDLAAAVAEAAGLPPPPVAIAALRARRAS